MKSGEITVVQEDINDDIMITSNVGDGNYPDASEDDDDDADAKEAQARAKAEEFAEIVSETDHDDAY